MGIFLTRMLELLLLVQREYLQTRWSVSNLPGLVSALRTIRRLVVGILAIVPLGGCVTWGDVKGVFAWGGRGASVAGAPLPVYETGDSFTFGEPPATWTVVAVKGNRVTWRNDSGDEQVTSRNPLLPALEWRSARFGSGRRVISDTAGALFPMRVGAFMRFKSTVTTDAPPYGWVYTWTCRVVDRQRVAGPAGPVDTFKVVCARLGSKRNDIVFYYAPAIGHYVLKESRQANGQGAIVRQLMAYRIRGAEPATPRVRVARRAGRTFGESNDPIRTDVSSRDSTVAAQWALPKDSDRGRARKKELARNGDRGPSYRLVRLPPVPRPKPTGAGSGTSVAERENRSPGEGRDNDVAKGGADITGRAVMSSMRPIGPVQERGEATGEGGFVALAHAAQRAGEGAILEDRARLIETTGMGDEALLAAAMEKGGAGGSITAATGSARETVPPPRRIATSRIVARAAPDTRPEATSARAPLEPVTEDPLSVKLYGVLLASYRNPRHALRGWKRLVRKHGDLLGELKPRIRRFDLGKRGVYYRLQAMPFVDKAAAASLCRKLVKRGASCRVIVL